MDSVGATARTPRNELSRWKSYRDEEESLPLLQHGAPKTSIAVVDDAPTDASDKYFKVGLYGLVNAIILVPLMISFAQIIFRDPVFQPFLSELVKLTMVSGAVHQLCFSLSSTLPFAVGQVQDAGLIFLSAMATSIVSILKASNDAVTMEDILSTTLWTLCGSTALLGVALIITGKLKLASFVQYLPMPVVGGYLSFIGFYCFEAGLSMMSSKEITSILDWHKLADAKSMLLCAPGVVGGIFLFVMTQRIRHFAVLPTCMLSILVVFYLGMVISGSSFEDARAFGWIAALPNGTLSVADMYKHFHTDLFHAEVLTPQIPTWIAMYFVVAFSSSLDVAAIEMALHKPLDHNAELQTVGWSNLVSGLTGGFTGSYIFSSTIFSMKSGVDSRWTGGLIFALEIALVLSPFSIIAYVPKLFFGSLNALIGIDLVMEWIVHAKKSMLWAEYAILWFTFLIMNFWNLEAGIVLGIAAAGINFILSYVESTVVRRVARQSLVKRDLRERALLYQVRSAIVMLELDGFVFFGSSVAILNQVRKHITTTDVLERSYAHVPTVRTRFVVLDFERVRGVDVTAVRSCFTATKEHLMAHGITLVFAALPASVRGMFELHDVLAQSSVFDTMEMAIEWCEDTLLQMNGATPILDQMQYHFAKGKVTPLLESFLPPPTCDDAKLDDALLQTYFVTSKEPAGKRIYESGDEVQGVYLVGKGQVDVFVPRDIHEYMGFEGRKRIVRVTHGAWLGDVDMVLNNRHNLTAETKSPCFLFYLDRTALAKMRIEHPHLAARFDSAMLQSMAMWIMESHGNEA
ncbi:hypothetical protein SDRG_15576 [Saprolegnia diclina VS20]|uniref:STAS domain-containing protein n=1 Tax=Saprolegnia diclina (strain VS20) TaxID=1156394 RepID=T0PWM3_SAPDV|nr:hypothetical protein SDRG_15576 [Saprolegnia diclina VS20]EQC26636.1 hypothetical protein SDRG_15576 [Saprolegnia diclina VS20]|eukprot:XP_008619974.1 hypothetical protein SDRG_15576 [Saprolegnia diclina VS20]